jgi:HlyD family secretion protein
VGVIHFDDTGRAWVEIKNGPTSYARREITLGLSDGINVEVVAGLDPNALVRVPDTL